MGRTPTKTRHSHVPASRYDTPSAHRPVGADRVSPVVDQTPLFAASGDFLNSFVFLASRDDGWLRMVPHDAGATVYYKWKFTRGSWAGHYIMYMDNAFDPSASIQGLLKKLQKVDAGELRPVRDRPFDE